MQIFWCETDPWLDAPEVLRRFCAMSHIAAQNFSRQEELAQHAAGRFLLHKGLQRWAPSGVAAPRMDGPGGKPYFPGRKPEFSISHAGNVALCAFSNSEVGVDVEKVAAVEPELLFVLRPEERALVQRTRQELQALTFYRLWTQKESLVKASGEGLAGMLELASVITPRLGWKNRLNGFELRRLPFLEPDYAVAASMREKSVTVTRVELPETADQLPARLHWDRG